MPYTTEKQIARIGRHKIRLRHPAYHGALITNFPCKKNRLNQKALDELLAVE